MEVESVKLCNFVFVGALVATVPFTAQANLALAAWVLGGAK